MKQVYGQPYTVYLLVLALKIRAEWLTDNYSNYITGHMPTLLFISQAKWNTAGSCKLWDVHIILMAHDALGK
jgi:hypothetical protein